MEQDNWDEEECIEELADICINSLRMINEKGYNPEKVILNRLQNHQEKIQKKLLKNTLIYIRIKTININFLI